MNDTSARYFSDLFLRAPELSACKDAIENAFQILVRAFKSGHKLLVCGNGGSAADAEHIVGELAKGFMLKRPLASDIKKRFADFFKEDGRKISNALQDALPVISLVSGVSLPTAFANDVNAEYIFAQQVWGLGTEGDVLWGMSTSGTAKNIIAAARTARIKDMKIFALTGPQKSIFSDLADAAVQTPGISVPRIQEYHLAVYHTICEMVEAEIFSV